MKTTKPKIDTSNRDQLVFYLPKLVINAGDLSQRVADVHIFAPFKLTTAKYTLLSVLAAHPQPPTMTGLKNRIMKSSSNLTQLIDALEESGDVKRLPAPADRRAYLIEITSKGRKLLKAVDDFRLEQLRIYMKDYSDKDMRTMLTLLRRYTEDCARLLSMDEATLPEIL